MIFLLYVIVFATGAAGLIFQVTWHVYLSRILGNDSIATAIILATFLGGLSFGYYLCGKLSTRLKSHVKAYALLEGLIGIWWTSFPNIFQAIDTLTRSWNFSPPFFIIVQGMTCSVLLIGVPTICMGGTLPFLTRGLSKNVDEATHIHAYIYAINTIGAFVGCLVAGFYLIPNYGLPITIMGTSFLNLGACFFFYLYSLAKPTFTEELERQEASQSDKMFKKESMAGKIPANVIYIVAFFSGFYVMVLENVLIRLTKFSIGSSSYSYSLIVSVFIFSIAIGSYVVGQLRKISHTFLFINQLLIACFLIFLYLSLNDWPYWAHLLRIAFQSNTAGFWAYYTGVFAALLATLFLPVAFMGATLPLAFHELKQDLSHVGKHSGLLFSWNTIGNLTGSLIGGIVLYYFLNTNDIFLIALFFAVGSACLIGWYLPKKYFLVAACITLIVISFFFSNTFYNQKHFSAGTFRIREPLTFSFGGSKMFFDSFLQGKDVKFQKDDPTSMVSVIDFPQNTPSGLPSRAIFVNGKPDSDTVGDLYTLKLLTHIAALLAESRKQVMVIGLGTGITAGEFTLYPDVEHVDIAEISPAIVEALPYFDQYTHTLSTDTRIQIHIGDAFRILGKSKTQWDIIVSEPSNPWVTGVDLLFTQEYYQLVKNHLRDNGILVQWVQMYETSPQVLGMILNTVQQEFLQVRTFRANPGDLLIIASDKVFSQADLLRAEDLLNSHEGVKNSLKIIRSDSLDSILIREVWPPGYIAKHFSNFGLQTMDYPYLHYMATKEFFIGERIPTNFIYTPDSATYWEEYLLALKYPDWAEFQNSPEEIEAFFDAARNAVHGNFFEFYPAVRLRAYLTDSTLYSLTPKEKEWLQIHLLPFIFEPQKAENWSRIGLANFSFRQKAELLLGHVKKFRNWIVPYQTNGLKALLREGISRSNDPYERNWCIIQLVLFLVQEDVEEQFIKGILDQLSRKDDGEIFIREQDKPLLYTLDNQLKKS